ncbi:MAG: phosphate transport regulator [Candidatus Schekmanbacteria bacterium RIFCSPHIGHO2_02_FULL_38_11]|uniref:Phosphate transport regulator n=1 Tax=Candidatus Schekmanbacteria bacterium RIFCSPLOWO2_12_FULL_38_15 TaxID=1817883 RepID=A0A1F7SLE1_9BACT|nr:MAG: phosphate transport regulator [Candidatus Schekmanbacteria bacterium GWA2_38_9]OGL48068.1 MAG: phosphate transport regulator [Candidatus Schekmanbacteria bacterium RIFCSPLOWO2_02_FULL_38_14]OGL49050.1 MAG: phosphate transport regulator [Candidatus Schekmanbacteria bacterium RIFCSPHIGHO2_02_FULL_38_11]OGL54589.1 MAG: phosphate transport regulator [Candidatus Schekmanbacteria bacterium RIFCSPLOWO2_12_FULL_38_15]
MFAKGSENVLEGARLLSDLITDYTDIIEKSKRIKEVEHEGDKITHDTVTKLNNTFITPLDREDIYSLICKMDDVLDFIDAVSSRMILYKVKFPTNEARALMDVLLKSVEEMDKAIRELRNIKKPEAILKYCIEINTLENKGDVILRDAVAKLFDDGTSPIDVIKWKEIYENLETAIDRCEDVANVIEGAVLKNA